MPATDPAALLAGRTQRAAQFLQAAADAAQAWYDSSGAWIADPTPAASRDRLWLSFALYRGTEAQQRLADAVVLATQVESFPDGHRFNIFDSNIAPLLVADFADRMSPAARDFLLDLTREGHHHYPGDRQCDYQFHGYNDNMPCDGTMSLILGAQLTGDRAALEQGRWQLRQLQEQLHRGGLLAEYTSPTYVPLSLHAMAALAELAEDPEDREIARLLERRIWADLAAHWHPQSRQLAGPHSRAYTTDVVGHLSNVRTVVWLMFGDEVAGLSPMSLFDPHPWAVYHHCGNLPFNISQMSWFIAGHYHLDLDLARLFVDKPSPFRLAATAELGDSHELPSRRTLCTTWLTPDFSLGCATTGYGNNAQTDSFFVTYPREGQEPVGGTIYCRYLLNDDYPGAPEEDGHWVGEGNMLAGHANSLTLHDGPTCLHSLHPHLALADREITRLRLAVIFPTHLGDVEELRLGDTPISSWEGEQDGLRQWIGVRAGRCLLGLRPLVYSALALKPRLVLESYDRYRVLAFENYRGEPRRFSAEELRCIFNGFVAEVAGVDEFGSLGEFLSALQPTRFEDYAMFRTRRLRYLRPALPGRPELELATSYTVPTCSPRFLSLNGEEVLPCPWDATGLSAAQVSVMPDGYRPRPPGIPWDSLSVFWYQEDRWAINENGRD